MKTCGHPYGACMCPWIETQKRWDQDRERARMMPKPSTWEPSTSGPRTPNPRLDETIERIQRTIREEGERIGPVRLTPLNTATSIVSSLVIAAGVVVESPVIGVAGGLGITAAVVYGVYIREQDKRAKAAGHPRDEYCSIM